MSFPVILASASPARLMLLRSQNIKPIVIASEINEKEIEAQYKNSATEVIVKELSIAKANYVLNNNVSLNNGILIAADSMLEFNSQSLGKPLNAENAIARWQQMRGKTGILHTGHTVIRLDNKQTITRVISTKVEFANVDDQEILDYVATTEPLYVAGAFTIDSLGAAFVKQVHGDHSNVVGLSLPALREIVRELGLSWTSLWEMA
ncbi:MAG: septum formation inhibitor Maf [Actinomycetota bacterium]|jgi:septum formation protein|nr:septum formation inhibitor Maf [Candidatus Nanopelagicales bacterium]